MLAPPHWGSSPWCKTRWLLIEKAACGQSHAGSSELQGVDLPPECPEQGQILSQMGNRWLYKMHGASLPCWAFGVPPPSSLALPVLPVSLPSVAPACPWSPSPLLQVDTRITVKPLVETIPCVGGVTISLLKVSFAWEACRAYGQFVWCGQTWRHEEAMRSEAGV
eukprot:scaffold12272_cov18-Tisochrysis_lutea.AAC.1